MALDGLCGVGHHNGLWGNKGGEIVAEYIEVIKQFKRMCWYYSRDKRYKSCPICTSYPNCNIGQCRKIAFEQPTCFKDVVMAWAAEHPEPVYPTWAEWLISIGAFDSPTHEEKEFSSVEILYKMRNMMFKPIPADIAEKLGIEPKEG